MEPCCPPSHAYAASSITRMWSTLHTLLHHKEERRSKLPTPTPPYNGVHGLFLVQMGIRSRTPTPLQGGEEIVKILTLFRSPGTNLVFSRP
eukprot:3278844-Ditylum_brightwellii.AAC.1